jgi:hypothetical protein
MDHLLGKCSYISIPGMSVGSDAMTSQQTSPILSGFVLLPFLAARKALPCTVRYAQTSRCVGLLSHQAPKPKRYP